MTAHDEIHLMPCTDCRKRRGCPEDCGDEDCPCRQVCGPCAARIDAVVARWRAGFRWGETQADLFHVKPSSNRQTTVKQ